MIDLFARFSGRCFGKISWQTGGSLDQTAFSAELGSYFNIIGSYLLE